MQKNINQKEQAKRRKEAFQSAIISSVMLLLASLTKLGLRWYYQMNDFFMKENQILENANKIKDIPVEIYQDRWDPCCPMYQAYDLHKALPKSKLHLIPAFGHIHEKMFWKMYQDNLHDYKEG